MYKMKATDAEIGRTLKCNNCRYQKDSMEGTWMNSAHHF